jgi:NAD(P)H dehydrogenase (quinone)
VTCVLVVYCHPLGGAFAEAMRAAVLAGLESVDAEVRLADLYADKFEPAYSAGDYANHAAQTNDLTLARYIDDLAWCDTLIFVYPTWWSGFPSMLTGWIDRVWASDAAHSHYCATADAELRRTNIKRIVAVTSHGSTKLINLLEGEAGKSTLTRAMRATCRRRVRTKWIALYGIDSSTLAQREAFLRKIQRRICNLR